LWLLKQKNPLDAGFFVVNRKGLLGYDVARLQTLRALLDVEAYRLTFDQAFEACALNGAKVNKYIITAVAL
jgi:hypothetical protein